MGCWNGTCGVTQLAIHAGDPVVGFILAKSYDNKWAQNGHCYSTDYWSPFSLHIEGTYNDYGSMENVDETNWNFQFTVERIRENMIENEEYNWFINKETLDWETISEAIHNDELALGVSKSYIAIYPDLKSQPLGFMMVHKSVFDAIVNNGFETWRGKVTLDILMEEGRNIVSHLRKKVHDINNLKDTKERRAAEFIFDLELENFNYGDKRTHLSSFVISNEGSNYNIGRTYVSFLGKKIIEGCSSNELDIYIKKLSEFYIFFYAMSLMRKTWMPQAGSGSQNAEEKLYKIVNEVTNNIIDEHEKLYGEYEEE